MKLFYLILLLVLFQDIAGLKAQTDLRFEYLSEQDGLSHPEYPKIIFVPYQDQAGKMWVGTDEALLYLDKGTGKFLQYPTAVRVQAIAEGQSGKLSFGGSKGGYIFEGALA